MRMLTLTVGWLATLSYCSGHGELTWPPSRNRASMATAGSCHGSNVFAEYQLGVCFWFSQCCQPGQAECTGQYRLPPAPEPPVVCGDEAKSLEPLIHPDDYAARTWRDYCEPGEGDCVDKTKYNPWRYPGKAPVLSSCGMAGGWKTATQVLQPVDVPPGMDGVGLRDQGGRFHGKAHTKNTKRSKT